MPIIKIFNRCRVQRMSAGKTNYNGKLNNEKPESIRST